MHSQEEEFLKSYKVIPPGANLEPIGLWTEPVARVLPGKMFFFLINVKNAFSAIIIHLKINVHGFIETLLNIFLRK